jgi:O-antigen/teichoic acid export membrane protein
LGKLRGMYDGLLLQLFRHTGILFGANILAAVLGLATLALATRGLGAEHLGVLVMIVAYVAVIDQFVNLQAWQAVIRFGAEALEKNETEDFRILVRAGFYLEVVSAIAGTLIAILLVLPVSKYADWNSDITLWVIAYSLSILFRITGTPTAVLRLFDRFSLVAVQTVLAAFTKLLGVAIGFAFDAGLAVYIIIWAGSDILGRVLLILFSFVELRKRGYAQILGGSVRGVSRRFPDIWGVVWTVNLSDAMRVVTRDLDTLVVGVFLGPSSTAMYKVAKQVADIPGKFANPLLQILYPYLARLWSRGEKKAFNATGRAVAIAMGCVGALFLALSLLVGEGLLTVGFGSDFGGASTTLSVLMFAYCIFYFGIHLRPKAMALGLHREILNVSMLATALFCVAYFPLVAILDVNGAAAAHVVFYAAWYISLQGVIRKRGGCYGLDRG